MANMLASIAAFETELRGERVRAGQQASRAAGKRWGGSKPGWRYKVTDQQIKAILAMKSKGETVVNIAKTVNLSRGSVYRVLSYRDQGLLTA